MIRFIADTHFGHTNIIKFDGRPFLTVEEMDEAMVANWNSVVQEGDTTYILGDFCWKTEKYWPDLLRQLNGSKVLVRGNHDLKSMNIETRSQFDGVVDLKEIKLSGKRIIMNHYPLMFYRGAYDPDVIMLCGHVHTTRENDFLNKWRKELRDSRVDRGDSYAQIINVGAMMPYIGYTPRTLEEIVDGYNKYVKEYDL